MEGMRFHARNPLRLPTQQRRRKQYQPVERLVSACRSAIAPQLDRAKGDARTGESRRRLALRNPFRLSM